MNDVKQWHHIQHSEWVLQYPLLGFVLPRYFHTQQALYIPNFIWKSRTPLGLEWPWEVHCILLPHGYLGTKISEHTRSTNNKQCVNYDKHIYPHSDHRVTAKQQQTSWPAVCKQLNFYCDNHIIHVHIYTIINWENAHLLCRYSVTAVWKLKTPQEIQLLRLISELFESSLQSTKEVSWWLRH